MFRSSGPRKRRPFIPPAPENHSRVRNQSAVLDAARRILAAADPEGDVKRADRPRGDARRREEVLRYLRLQGGVVADRKGLVTTHLRAALNRGPSLHRLLQAMEADGLIAREVRGRRTFSVRLVNALVDTADTDATRARPNPSGAHGSRTEESTTPHADFLELAHALLEIIEKRIAAVDPGNRARLEQLERYRGRLAQDIADYEVMRTRRDAPWDPAAERAFFEHKLSIMVTRASEYEQRTGFRMDHALTDSEVRTLSDLVRSAATRPA